MAMAPAPAGGYQNGGWYWDSGANGARQYWNGQFGPTGNAGANWWQNQSNNNNSGGGQSMPSQEDIDKAFSGVYSGLDQATNTLTANRDSALATAQKESDNASGLIPGQQQQLQDTLNQSKTAWQQGTQSAYGDALRAYNALQQRNLGLFGGQSSAAGAANDLLNQQYLQTRGQIGNEDQSAQLQFDTQNQDISNWVADTTMKIKNWYLDASQQIQNQFAQGMAQINTQRGQTDTDKAMAKLNLVSTLVQHQQALQEMNQQYQQYAQLAATTGVPTPTPLDMSGFKNTMSNNYNALGNTTSNLISSAGISPSFNPAQYTGAINTTMGSGQNKKADPFANLS